MGWGRSLLALLAFWESHNTGFSSLWTRPPTLEGESVNCLGEIWLARTRACICAEQQVGPQPAHTVFRVAFPANGFRHAVLTLHATLFISKEILSTNGCRFESILFGSNSMPFYMCISIVARSRDLHSFFCLPAHRIFSCYGTSVAHV